MKKRRLIVASASPRRRELLAQAGFEFLVEPSDADETLADFVTPAMAVEQLAERKARSVAEKHSGDVVLGCDTIVALDGEKLGKPQSADDAKAMLRRLSGQTHTVYTGVCITDGTRTERFVSATDVTFYPLSAQTIDDYVATGEPMDKAGAYGIQGLGSVLVQSFSGDYFTVVGLPLAQCARVLAVFGIEGKIKL
ncbi:MAG: septum formation inhibitor Maf [Clostridia bacterium]|nr:septum formation inhibitor Maf [Clostridia bacterium]